ncbi:MAG: lytic murein transglycosylase [Acidimicrobiales bacterium]
MGVFAVVALTTVLVVGVPEVVRAEDALYGYTPTAADPGVEPLTAGTWIDPAQIFGYDEFELVAPDGFTFPRLHDSTIFASGVDWVAVDDDVVEEAKERHLRTRQVVATIERDIDSVSVLIRVARPRVIELNGDIEHEISEEARLDAEIIQLENAIAEFALRAFIGEDPSATSILADDDSSANESRVLSGQVREAQFEGIENRVAEREQRVQERHAMEDERRALRRRIAKLRQDRLDLMDDRRIAHSLESGTAAGYQLALHERLPKMITGTDIPLVAFNAYVIAERTLAEEDPSCGIEWWMLAGIGHIESLHGHFADSELDIDGNTTTAIRGPALDGRILSGAEGLDDDAELPAPTDRTETTSVTAGAAAAAADSDAAPVPPGEGGDPGSEVVVAVKRLALIEDTDDGRFDDDRTYDRAVGPMQFIPQTWRQWGNDVNGDGEPDPQNVYDAAMSSARYLCGSTNTMQTIEGRERGFFAYNHDVEYSIAVEKSAQGYRSKVTLPAFPLGTTRPLGIATPIDDTERAVAQSLLELDVSGLPSW